MRAAIIAGGRGVRMGEGTNELPKPMLPVGPKPLLEHQIELFARSGIQDITLCIGYLSHTIQQYFGTGQAWGVRIRYSVENQPLGTAGSLRLAFPNLREPLFVLYGDIMVNIDLKAFANFHLEHGGAATLAVHPNDHMHDSDLIELDGTHRIVHIHRKPHNPHQYYPNLDNCGFYIIEPGLIELIPATTKCDFAHDVFPKALQSCLPLYGYRTAEYLKDIGTPERYDEVVRDWQLGRVERLHRSRPRPAIFLDRDGVLTREVHHLHHPEQLDLMPGVAEAVRIINESDFLAILVTNQSVVARGLCSETELRVIHHKLETLLGYERAWLDAIYYCPHHPEHEFNRVKTCRCRKPETGLIEMACRDFNIDFSNSFIIGDSTSDVETARQAGITPVLVRTGYGGTDRQYQLGTVRAYDDLLGAVKAIVRGEST